jgi:hypothetical protein
MIKSKPNLFYVLFSLAMLTIGLIGIVIGIRTWADLSGILFLLGALALWIIIFLRFLNDTSQIEIDEGEVRIKNWLTRRIRKYTLKDLDYRIECEKLGQGGLYKLLFLTKNKKIELMTTNIFYVNYDEIFWGLGRVPLLRYPKIGFIKRILFLIGIKLKVEVNESAKNV